MIMRLIDADKMKIGISEKTRTDNEASRFIDIIDNQSTAYNLDKVIEKLRTELTLADEEKKRSIKENSLQFDIAKGYAQGIAVAIEIVKYEAGEEL